MTIFMGGSSSKTENLEHTQRGERVVTIIFFKRVVTIVF
jgi:hypothetical protein